MRIKIMVASAIALAAIGLKSLDSGEHKGDRNNDPGVRLHADVSWPQDESGPNSP